MRFKVTMQAISQPHSLLRNHYLTGFGTALLKTYCLDGACQKGISITLFALQVNLLQNIV